MVGRRRRTTTRRGKNAMAFIPVAGVLEAEIRMSLDDQLVENTLYFKPTPDSEAGTPIALAADLLVWWTVSMAPALSDNTFLREIYVTDLTTATSGAATQPAPAPAPHGGRTGAPSPNNVSLAVSFRTAQRGRSFRGRNYIAGINEPDTEWNQISATLEGLILAGYNELLSAPFSTDWQWGVVSRFANKAPRAAGVFTPITAVTIVDRTIDSQRRRLPSRGR